MIDFNKLLIRVLLTSVMALPWAAAPALEVFERAGAISAIGIDRFTVAGRHFRIAPGAQLRSDDANRRQFRDFQEGDRIWFKGRKLNDINYVDIIVYETPDEN